MRRRNRATQGGLRHAANWYALQVDPALAKLSLWQEEWMRVSGKAGKHSLVLGWNHQTLHVGAESGAWKQWILLNKQSILHEWAQEQHADSSALEMRISVAPSLLRDMIERTTDRPAQPEAASALEEVANALDDDALAASLRALANTLAACHNRQHNTPQAKE